MTQFRPGRFEILPTIIKNLLIINTLVFLAQYTFGKTTPFINDTFALHTWQSPLFKPWQFVTYMFMHGGWGHLFGNMFFLWMFGSVLETMWGPKRFLTFYIISGLGAALCHMIVLYFEFQPIMNSFNDLPIAQQQMYMNELQNALSGSTVGASGAVFGCIAAFGYLFPNDYIYVYFLFPIKVKWFVIFYAGAELLLAAQNSTGDTVAHVAHLGGAAAGFLMVYFWNKRPPKRWA